MRNRFLDMSYILDSEKAGKFLPEQSFEMTQLEAKVSKFSIEERATVSAAKRWRVSLFQDGRRGMSLSS